MNAALRIVTATVTAVVLWCSLELVRTPVEPLVRTPEVSSVNQSSATTALAPPALNSPDSESAPTRATRAELAEMMIDPPYNFDPSTMKASDFGPFFSEEMPITRTETVLLSGTPYKTTLTMIEGMVDGPTVFVVAGIHGDETAGYSAGNLLKDVSIAAGRLCILSPANTNGVANNTRYVVDKLDLNRSFPGRANGNTAEHLADAIYVQVKGVKPDLLLDLHEARLVTSDKADYLGSALIYSSLSGMEDLFFDLLFATQTGELCSEPFNYYAPGPAGSINRTVTEKLGIPVITIETFRGYPLERRIADQLALVQYVLNYYDMC